MRGFWVGFGVAILAGVVIMFVACSVGGELERRDTYRVR